MEMIADWIPLSDSEAINPANWKDHWKLCTPKGSETIGVMKEYHPDCAMPALILSCLSKGGWIERPQYDLSGVEGWELVDVGNGRSYLKLGIWVMADDGVMRRGDHDFYLLSGDQIISTCDHIRNVLETQ